MTYCELLKRNRFCDSEKQRKVDAAFQRRKEEKELKKQMATSQTTNKEYLDKEGGRMREEITNESELLLALNEFKSERPDEL